MSRESRIEKAMLKIFSTDKELSRTCKIVYTKSSGGNIMESPTEEEVILKKNGELIDSFFLNPVNDIGEVISEYDGELLIRDLKFDITTVSFSTGVYVEITSYTLFINGNELDISEVEDLDGLLDIIDKVDNIFTFKLSDTEFVIISSKADEENDVDYQDLEMSGTAIDILGLDENSNKAIVKIIKNNIDYSVKSVNTGDYLKTIQLIRG